MPEPRYLSRSDAEALAQKVLSFSTADEARVNINSGTEGNTRFAVNQVSTAGDAASLADALVRAIALARRPETAAACRASATPYDWDDGIAPLLEELYADGPRR